MKFQCKITVAMAACLAALAPSFATAQSTPKASAKVTMFGADTAMPIPRGDVFFGLTYTTPRGGVKGRGGDGDLSFGAGFGSPIDAIGFQATANITSVHPSDFGDSGSFGFKAARALILQPNHVVFGAISAGNVGAWGDGKGSDATWNVTVSGITQIDGAALIHPVMWTIGYGSDAVLSTAGSSQTEAGLFGGVGIGVTRNIGFSVSATKSQLNAGIGFSIPGLDGVNVSYGINDIANNMKRRQQTLSISYNIADFF